MKEIFNYYTKILATKTLSLKKKGILINTPWAMVDSDGEIQKLIFKSNNELIMAKNGKVKEGKWEYFPEAMALLIDRVEDKLLLKEQFIDENVLILKVDGTNNNYFALANENTIADYNILAYLNSLRCKIFGIKEVEMLSGKCVQFIDCGEIDLYKEPERFVGLKIETIDDSLIPYVLKTGNYMTNDKRRTFYVDNGYVSSVTKNSTIYLINGGEMQIENGYTYQSGNIHYNINKIVKINGKEVEDSRILDNRNYVYEIKNSQISKIYFLAEYVLKDGSTIKIEQGNFDVLKKGDKIIDSRPVNPLPDGEYKIKGRWSKIKVVNSIIL